MNQDGNFDILLANKSGIPLHKWAALDQDFYRLLENTTARLGAVESDLAESIAVAVRLESALLSIANFITNNRDAMDHKTQNWMAHIQMRINHEIFYGSQRAAKARKNSSEATNANR